MPEIVIIRGVPGSGKTTMAKRDFPSHKLIEADQFFIGENGIYEYDRSKIKEAHKWCQKTALESLKRGENIVVANTFIKIWEMQPYFDMGYSKKVIIANGNFNNIHNVPPDIVKRMRDNFEKYSC